ncbi:hypothetical protein [Sphingomonas sp.]|uniref:hypothetical protein n=1 Tax=Sphingomonas sp. TaxID=28214 RepID=UPI003AFF92DF
MLRIASSTLRVVSRPAIAPTTLVASATAGLAASFSLSRRLEAIGSVVFHGAAGDSTAGWTVGFVQAQWIETNWAFYQGAADHDGSLFVQRARPPSRPHQACFDSTAAGSAFYANAAEPAQIPAGGHTALPFVAPLPANPVFPLTVQAFHADRPGDQYDLGRQNVKTGAVNLLHDAQLEFAFCAILVVREPSGQRHFLKGFYWNVNWQNHFRTTSNAASVPTALRAGTHANVGHIFEGRPNDRRFADIFTQATPINCNAVAGAAAANPNVREETRWHSFDVRR